MNVTCALCNIKEELDDASLKAKKLRNHPIIIHICDSCYHRIKSQREQKEDKGK